MNPLCHTKLPGLLNRQTLGMGRPGPVVCSNDQHRAVGIKQHTTHRRVGSRTPHEAPCFRHGEIERRAYCRWHFIRPGVLSAVHPEFSHPSHTPDGLRA